MCRTIGLTLIAALVCLLSTGCSAGQAAPTATATPTARPAPSATPSLTPPPGVEEVSFTTADDLRIAGRLYGDGEVAVILAHMGAEGATQDTWTDFAWLLAGRGFAALTFDFRGLGLSEGEVLHHGQIILDTRAAIEFLRGRGYERIACIGASMGGTTCLKAAAETDLIGVATVGSTMSTGNPDIVLRDDLAALTIPKLFISTEDDRMGDLAGQAQHMYEIASEPKAIRFFPGSAHGTEMFDTPYGEEFSEVLVDFLEGLR